jgi:hypothetical protein
VHSFGVRPPPSDAFIGPHNPIVRDGLLYYAYYDGGVRVFDLLDPTRPIEIGYYSYPGFAWSAQIELSLYNLRGQRIATLATGARSAGLYSFAWDGRDDSGHALASGVYLYRLRAGQRTDTRKLTLLR